MTDPTKFEDTVFRSYPTGSRYICNPPPTDTDNDTVFLVNGFYDYASILINDGWEPCGEYDNTGQFQAFRKGDQNYIITENDTFFERYVVATEGAKALNLLNKEDRIKLFQSICEASSGHVGFRVINPLEVKPKVKWVFNPDGRVVRAAVAADPEPIDNFFDRVFVRQGQAAVAPGFAHLDALFANGQAGVQDEEPADGIDPFADDQAPF